MTVDEYKKEVCRIRPQLLLTARRYMGDEDEAEDVVQDVLLKLWHICETLRLPIDRLAMVLVRNHCVDELRRKRKGPTISENMAEESSDGDERIEQMMAIVNRLPGLQQTILRLRHMENMSMAEIARLTGSTEVAVRKALSRARQAVRLQFLKQNDNE